MTPLLKRLRHWAGGRVGILKAICRAIRFHSSPFTQAVPPGHFYSPIPDIGQIIAKKEEICGVIP